MVKSCSRIFSFVLVLLMLFGFCNHSIASRHRLTSYNIRIITSADSLERSWEQRKNVIATMLKDDIRADVIGLQEVSETQETELTELLGNTFSFCSCNFSAGPIVLYRTDKYDCLDHGIFYLSPNPKQAEKGWDALYVRMSVWVRLQDKNTHESFVFCSTHLDLTPLSITQGAWVNVEQLQKIAGDSPCVIVGDMNSTPSDEAYAVYNSFFQDARQTCKGKIKDCDDTFFEAMNPKTEGKRIDYIYGHNVKMRRYHTVKNTFNRLWLPSDHIPVVCDIKTN